MTILFLTISQFYYLSAIFFKLEKLYYLLYQIHDNTLSIPQCYVILHTMLYNINHSPRDYPMPPGKGFFKSVEATQYQLPTRWYQNSPYRGCIAWMPVNIPKEHFSYRAWNIRQRPGKLTETTEPLQPSSDLPCGVELLAYCSSVHDIALALQLSSQKLSLLVQPDLSDLDHLDSHLDSSETMRTLLQDLLLEFW